MGMQILQQFYLTSTAVTQLLTANSSTFNPKPTLRQRQGMIYRQHSNDCCFKTSQKTLQLLAK